MILEILKTEQIVTIQISRQHFRASADINITREKDANPSTEEPTTTTTLPEESTSALETTTTTTSEGSWQSTEANNIDDWCEANCHHPIQPYCPQPHCNVNVLNMDYVGM